MDITVLSPDCIKIKGKQASFIVDPGSLTVKNSGDAVILLKDSNETFNSSKIEGCRVIINGQGEYEVSSAKISGTRFNKDLFYKIQMDDLAIILAKADLLEKIKDKISGNDVLVIYVNKEIDESVVAAIEPKIAVFYGSKSSEILQTLSKDMQRSSKVSTTKDKLPEELGMILLE